MMHLSRIAIENFRNFSEFDVTLSGNVVRLKPVTDDGPRYLNATFEGGDMALLEWLAIGDLASQPGLSALVAGARIVDYLRVRLE